MAITSLNRGMWILPAAYAFHPIAHGGDVGLNVKTTAPLSTTAAHLPRRCLFTYNPNIDSYVHNNTMSHAEPLALARNHAVPEGNNLVLERENGELDQPTIRLSYCDEEDVDCTFHSGCCCGVDRGCLSNHAGALRVCALHDSALGWPVRVE